MTRASLPVSLTPRRAGLVRSCNGAAPKPDRGVTPCILLFSTPGFDASRMPLRTQMAAEPPTSQATRSLPREPACPEQDPQETVCPADARRGATSPAPHALPCPRSCALPSRTPPRWTATASSAGLGAEGAPKHRSAEAPKRRGAEVARSERESAARSRRSLGRAPQCVAPLLERLRAHLRCPRSVPVLYPAVRPPKSAACSIACSALRGGEHLNYLPRCRSFRESRPPSSFPETKPGPWAEPCKMPSTSVPRPTQNPPARLLLKDSRQSSARPSRKAEHSRPSRKEAQ
jgi:hypothetical protein